MSGTSEFWRQRRHQPIPQDRSGLLEIFEDPWLGAILGHEAFRIDVRPAAAVNQDDIQRVCESLHAHARQRSAAMYYAKVDTSEISALRGLSSAGLYVVDVNVTFGLDTDSLRDQSSPSHSEKVKIVPVQPEHHEQVLSIAASCFRYSRFHLDPLISDEIANQIKRAWILNYILGKRGERLYAALVNGHPVGFLAVLASEIQGKRIRIIDLIGVGKDSQKQGVGRALVAFFIRHYGDRCDQLQVGTQIANAPSIRLYQKSGFAVMKSQYVMHMHVQNGHWQVRRPP